MEDIVLEEPALCEGCGEPVYGSVVTDCHLDPTGHPRRTLVHFGREGFVHLHGVSIATAGALTVRGSLHRWANHVWVRSRWHARRLKKLIGGFR